jgi:hypothetical protein
MNITTQYDNFIGIYDGAFSIETCDKLIDYFKWCQNNSRTYTRANDEILKKDESCNLNPTSNEINFSFPHIQHLLQEFNTGFWDKCYKDYTNTYSDLNNYQDHTIYTYKVQKTMPSGGYHSWHSEDGEKTFSTRIGVYILYLNDVAEGGETEFLYLAKRVAPKKGRLVIFPPNYPWAHRGNPPLSGEKYIMTGWTEFR